MKIGVFLDGARLARWQAEALETLAGEAEFVIYSCTTPAPARRQLRHALYYLLNLATVRNRMTRRIGLPAALRIIATHAFAAPCEGRWQALPPDLVERIAHDRPDVLVKFGLGLITIPPAEQLAVPILSWHHGDPAKFRGRPAGFHELAQGEPTVGQIVQILSNRLDSGRIVAAAETRAFAHSYRATLVEAYRHSPLLLRTAIRNALAGTSWEPPQWGPAYRLPGNAAVAGFVLGRARAAASHLLYGLTRTKQWSVATAPAPEPLTLERLTERLGDEAQWRAVATPPGYCFLADPFFADGDGLLVEAMRAASARGEILRLAADGVRRLSGRGGHFSYPALIEAAGRHYVVPETSDWSPPQAYPLGPGGLGEPLELKLPGHPRLLDPTPFRHGDAVFLFGNVANEGQSVLRLWVADALDAEFAEHPASPIRISPEGGRMAGTPILVDGTLVRVGQDLRRGYGDGISLFRVTRIDRERYEEVAAGTVRFAGRHGPHTLNLARGQMAFDHYEDRFSLLAGLRRWRERRAARRIGV
ncbi:MAG TPA: hypothetical protein VN640_07195 [Sphingomicrobium sp.]|nr:hypothetical protein [Sphingomicrobium sp.]